MLTWSMEHPDGDIKGTLGSRAQGNDHSRATMLEANGLLIILETS